MVAQRSCCVLVHIIFGAFTWPSVESDFVRIKVNSIRRTFRQTGQQNRPTSLLNKSNRQMSLDYYSLIIGSLIWLGFPWRCIFYQAYLLLWRPYDTCLLPLCRSLLFKESREVLLPRIIQRIFSLNVAIAELKVPCTSAVSIWTSYREVIFVWNTKENTYGYRIENSPFDKKTSV